MNFIKTLVLLPQTYVALADFGFHILSYSGFLAPKCFFLIIWLSNVLILSVT